MVCLIYRATVHKQVHKQYTNRYTNKYTNKMHQASVCRCKYAALGTPSLVYTLTKLACASQKLVGRHACGMTGHLATSDTSLGRC